MARKKKVSDKMDDLIDALREFRQAESTIKAHYAAIAEKEISIKRDRVMEMMFLKHHDAGPSEIANTTGLSRSTVIRWRKEFEAKFEPKFSPLSDEEYAHYDGLISDGDYSAEEIYGVGGKSNQVHSSAIKFDLVHDADGGTDVHLITNNSTGESVFVIWSDVFAVGETPMDATMIMQPEWLTEEVMRDAERSTGMKIPGLN